MSETQDWRIVRGKASPAMHMALDEVITDRVANGQAPPTLRIWEWADPAVVIGRFQAVRDEVFEEMAAQYGVQVVRRITGGGAMFTEPERVITYSLSLPEEMVESDSITESYRELEGWTLDALEGLGAAAEHKPINDIVNGEQKIGGSAQARTNGAVLHHTMLAYDMDIPKMLKVLKIGKEKISDKAIQSAEKRVSPIATQIDASREEVLQAMLGSFKRQYGGAEGELLEEELAAAKELVHEKFGTQDWTYHVDREIEGFET